MDKNKVLIIQSNEHVANLLLFTLESEFALKGETVSDPKLANAAMHRYKDIGLIIYDKAFGEDNFNFILDYVINTNYEAAVFINGDKPLAIKEEYKDYIDENLHSVDLVKQIVNSVQKYFKKNETKKASEFCRISFKTLASFVGLTDDVFIKMPSGRFLKLYRKEDKITDQDVDKYAAKGVYDIYLNREVAEWLLANLKRDFKGIVKKLSDNKKVQLQGEIEALPENPIPASPDRMEVKPEEIHQQAKKIVDVFMLNKEFVEQMDEKVEKMEKMITQNRKISSLLRKMNIRRDKNNFYQSHVKLLTTVSCGISKAMMWNQSATLEKLIFASQLHDISLAEHPDLTRIRDLADLKSGRFILNDEEKEIFLNHPIKSVEIIEQLDSYPVEADKIILQHHELPGGFGFPNKVQAQKITPMSALFIVSHDLTHYILENPKWQMRDYIKEALVKFKGNNFIRVIKSLPNF